MIALNRWRTQKGMSVAILCHDLPPVGVVQELAESSMSDGDPNASIPDDSMNTTSYEIIEKVIIILYWPMMFLTSKKDCNTECTGSRLKCVW